jgi:hypothetical protein
MFCLNLDRFVSIRARPGSLLVLIYFSKLSGLPSLVYYVSIAILYSMNCYMFYKICKQLMDHSPINQNFDLNKSRQNSITA